MKFKTHNDKNIQSGGTSGQGRITTTYAQLVETFGKPSDNFDDNKSDAEWEVEFEDGTIVTIYNWKNGKNYCGPSGTPKTKITDWNIGGNSQESVRLVSKALSKK
jgi:major membrane immunogen (membrane-anchored lipoprotein)